jgi:hypothetical protein
VGYGTLQVDIFFCFYYVRVPAMVASAQCKPAVLQTRRDKSQLTASIIMLGNLGAQFQCQKL